MHSLYSRRRLSYGRSPTRVVEKSYSEKLDLATLPARHFLRSFNLACLNLAFKTPAWDAHEFSRGAVLAFTNIHSLLEAGKLLELQGLVSDELINQMRSDNAYCPGSRKLLDVEPLGIFKTRLKPELLGGPHWQQTIFVTQLFRAVEAYSMPGVDPASWHVERLHQWTFKRVLLNNVGEVMGPWQVVAVNKRRWQLPCRDDSRT